MVERAINRFADWFGSVACVIQTLTFCATLAAGEALWPRVDPSNLHYLYALTVYSAITQPALAFAAERLGRRLLDILNVVLALARNEAAVQDTLAAQSDTIAAQTGAIALALEELRRHLTEL